jgi:hypothetical protein
MTVVSLSNNVIFNTPSKNIFDNCTSLTNINMPGVTQINESWFSGCTSLTNISLPSVTTIENNAFIGCTSLTNISFTLGYNYWTFVDDLNELYEDTKTNYNNLFMSLSDNDKQRYIKTLSTAFSETHDLSIKLGQPRNIINDINTKIYTHTNNLLNVVNA